MSYGMWRRVCTDIFNDRSFFVFMVRLWKTAWPWSWRSSTWPNTQKTFLSLLCKIRHWYWCWQFIDIAVESLLTLVLTLYWHWCLTVYWHCCWQFTDIAFDSLLTMLLTVYWHCCWQFSDIAFDSLLTMLLTVYWHPCCQFTEIAFDSLLTVLLKVYWRCWQFTDIAFDSLLTMLLTVCWHCFWEQPCPFLCKNLNWTYPLAKW